VADERVKDPSPTAATFFPTTAEFRAWLEANHAIATELWVGLRKKGSKLPSITLPEAQDEAICFGWIDGLMHGIDADSYRLRFTPRKKNSNWSRTNVERVESLTAQGRMRPAGLLAFAARTGAPRERPSNAELNPEDEALFRADEAAWGYFQSRPTGYRRLAIGWVYDAKRDETRHRRLQSLIADSAADRPFIEARRFKPGGERQDDST
jgi:uncharacterized protein YdeI (YjbR/CyaY-like superfamily)